MTTPPTTHGWYIIRDFSRPLPFDSEAQAKEYQHDPPWLNTVYRGKIVPADFQDEFWYRTRDASYAQESSVSGQFPKFLLITYDGIESIQEYTDANPGEQIPPRIVRVGKRKTDGRFIERWYEHNCTFSNGLPVYLEVAPASQPEGEGVALEAELEQCIQERQILIVALERIRSSAGIPGFGKFAHIYTIADEAIKAATTNQKEVPVETTIAVTPPPEVQSSEQAATGSPPESVREDRLSAQVAARKHLVESAGYWFKASRRAQREGRNAEAILAMENAYNHVENALSASQADSKRLDWFFSEKGEEWFYWFCESQGRYPKREDFDKAMVDQKEGA